MGINTLGRKKILPFYLLMACFGLVLNSSAQCPTVSSPNQSFCDVESPTVGNLVATPNGNGIAWYDTASSTTALSNAAGLVSGDYYADDVSGTCGARQRVDVIIYTAPTGLSFQGVCVDVSSNATLANLVVSGNNIKWYATPSNGAPLPLSTVLTDETIYYASQTNPSTSCETSRLSVFVNVGVVPVPTGDPTQDFCNTPVDPPNVANLVATGNLRWYSTISSASPLPLSTPLVNGQSYFATTVDPPCESATRFQVNVTLIAPNNAGTAGQRRICISDIPTTAPFNLFALLGGTPDNNGTWTGPLSTSNGNLGTVNVSTLTVAGSPYVFTYSVSSSACSTASQTVTIFVLPLPTASITVSASSVCSGSSAIVNFTGTPNATVTYNIGGGNQFIVLDASGAAAIINNYTSTTTFNLVSVATAGPPSCSQTLSGMSRTITVIALPTVTVNSPPVCSGTNATVTANPLPAGTYSYAWTIPAGATPPGNVPSFMTAVAGNYSVIVTNTATTCSSLSASGTVIINPLPTVTVNSPSVCPGLSVPVTATPAPTGIYSYVWTVPSGAAQPGNVSTFNASVAGTYSVIVTNTDTSCVSMSGSGILTVNPLPTVTVSSPPVCSGNNATVTATPLPAGNYSYVWTVPSGATPPGNVNTFPTSVAGTYSVIVTNTTTNCVSTSASGVVVINPVPAVTVSSPPVCIGTNATVTATPLPAGTYTYAWTVPAGAANPGTVATFPTAVAGTYSVIITDLTTNCSSVSASGTVVINPLPVVTVNNPAICPGGTATITATPVPTGSYSYAWTVPSGVAPPGNVAGFPTTIAGNYSVIITNTTTNCSSTSASGTVTINLLPTVTVNSPSVCPGHNTIVTATALPSSTYSYAWTIPSGATPPGDVSTFPTTVAGTYSVIVTNTVTTCVSQPGVGTVTVNPLPTVVVNSQAVCAGTSATITATPGTVSTYSYAWTVPSGVTPPGNIPSFISTVAGTYSVIITDTATTCVSASTSGTVTVNTLPTVFVSSSSLCAGSNATITATPGTAGNYTYVWTVPAGVTDPGNVATFVTTLAGTYSVIITDVATTCSNTIAATVTINPLPTVTVNSPSICPGVAATVSAAPSPAGNYSYIWTVPSGALDPGNVSTFTTSVVGTYSVIITDPVTTCTSLSGSGIVATNPLPTVMVNDATICSGSNATITATPGTGMPADYSYAWTVPAVVTPPGNVSTFTTAILGTYSVVITNLTSTCVSNPASGTVIVNPLPTVIVTGESVCSGANATVTATPGSGITADYSYAWTVPAGVTLPGNVSTFITTTGGTYSVIITNLTTTCPSASASGTVIINPLPIATISSSGTVCSGTTASVLFAGTPNSTVTYTINSTTTANINIGPSGTVILSIPLTITSTFGLVSVTLINPPSCTQTLTGSTTMTVAQPPVAGSNANLTICSNGIPQDLLLLLGTSAQPGGTWFPVLQSGNNIFDPSLDAAGPYVYTVAGTPPCVNDTALVNVSITLAPNAGINGTANLCSNVDPVDLITYLGGTPQTGGNWQPALASGTSIFDPMVDAAGSYSYTVPGTGSCGEATATVVVNITMGPNAGVSTSTTLCINSSPIHLFPLLGTTAETGGSWLPVLASGTDLFDPALDPPGPHVYSLSGNQPCDIDTATVIVNVNPLPDAGDSTNTDICSNASPVDLLTRLGGTPQNGGTWLPVLASGTNMFDPAIDAAGPYTYTVGNPFCTPDSAVLSINIVAGPEAGLPGAITFCITDTSQDLFLSLGGTPQTGGTWLPALASGTGIFNPAVDAADVYTYTLSGNQPCDNDTATVTVNVNPIPDAGMFSGILNVCNSQGTFDLNTLLSGAQTGGEWTDSSGTIVTNVVDVSSLPEATYSYTYTIRNTCGEDFVIVQFTILPNPVLTAANILVSSQNCKGDNVTVSFSGMVDGAYILNYNLSISNLLSNLNAPVTIFGGTGIFTINANDIQNVGNTRITFLNITNATTSCTAPINPNVSADFIIRPTSDIDSINLSIANVCSGTDATVQITGAVGLTDGNYQFVYSLPGATPDVATTGIIVIVGGSGQFIVPSAVLTSAGNYTLTITSIVNLSGGCNNLTENANTSFEIYLLPDLSTAVLTSAVACVNTSNIVHMASSSFRVLPTGSYNITYTLSGATTMTNLVTVIIANGSGDFTIPATDLSSAGNVTVTITQIVSVLGLCAANVILIDPITFEVIQLDTPILNPQGSEFCADDNPTVANLTANIAGTQTVIWYNASTGGTIYADTDLLVDGTIYFAAYTTSSGCESPTRLPVTVDLGQCDDIMIPDGFSPNGDNINDAFVIAHLADAYPGFKLEIYNRYGNILYKGNINTPNWDGTTTVGGVNIGSNTVPVGVYFYILEFNDGIRDAKQGRLYLSR